VVILKGMRRKTWGLEGLGYFGGEDGGGRVGAAISRKCSGFVTDTRPLSSHGTCFTSDRVAVHVSSILLGGSIGICVV